MSNLDYRDIQNINIEVTKKLLQYIADELEKPHIIDTLESLYNDFYTHNISFDLWLSFDFLDEKGYSFIDRFLENQGHDLDPEEIQILEARNNSNISLFEILDIEGDTIHVNNLLENKRESLWEEDLAQVVDIGDLIFSRTANLLGLNTFIGSISYLPRSVRDTFLKEVFLDFNRLNKISSSLDIKTYLKNHSINLYTIYTNSVFQAVELEYDISSIFYDELEEFQSYLDLKLKDGDKNKIISNLFEFFEYYLVDQDLSLRDLDKIDFNQFFYSSIEEGFIMSSGVLNSYIHSLKIYLGFLSNVNKKYKEAYKNIRAISNSRFHFMDLLKKTKVPFKIDESFCNTIKGDFNDFHSMPIVDFDKFILYLMNSPVELTAKGKKIKRSYLLEINNMMDLSEEVKKSAPNQRDFPLIDLYYNISLFLGLAEIKNKKLTLRDKGISFLRLRDEEKFTIFFDYVWSKNFVETIDAINGKKTFSKYKKHLLDFLSSLERNTKYEMLDVFPKSSIDTEFFFHYYQYLKFLGIIDYKLYPSYQISITNLGKTVVEYLLSRNDPGPSGKIIHMDNYKNNNL